MVYSMVRAGQSGGKRRRESQNRGDDMKTVSTEKLLARLKAVQEIYDTLSVSIGYSVGMSRGLGQAIEIVAELSAETAVPRPSESTDYIENCLNNVCADHYWYWYYNSDRETIVLLDSAKNVIFSAIKPEKLFDFLQSNK